MSVDLSPGQTVHGLTLTRQLWEDALVSVWGARNEAGESVILRLLKSEAWPPERLQRCLRRGGPWRCLSHGRL